MSRGIGSPVIMTQIAKFMGPTWGPPGSCWPHETCYQGIEWKSEAFQWHIVVSLSGGNSSSGSGRARSDPTHQHRAGHPGQVHSHSAHQGAQGITGAPTGLLTAPGATYVNTTSLMECESPSQSRLQELSFLAQNKSGMRSVWSDLERSRLGSSPVRSTLYGPRPGAHNPAVESSSSMTLDLGPQQMGPINLNATRTGSVDMHLPGYPNAVQPLATQGVPTHAAPTAPQATYASLPSGYMTAPAFPLVLTSPTTSNLTSEGAPRTDHEETPMVGVCVQQSPVASH